MIIGAILLVFLVYFIVQRIEDKKKENFEERDN